MPDEEQEKIRAEAQQGEMAIDTYVDPIEERDILKLLKMLTDERVRNLIVSFIAIEIDVASFFSSARVRKEIKEIVSETKGGNENA